MEKNQKLTVEYYKMLNERWVINENIVKVQKKSSTFLSKIFGKFGDKIFVSCTECLKVHTGTYFVTKKPWSKRNLLDMIGEIWFQI